MARSPGRAGRKGAVTVRNFIQNLPFKFRIFFGCLFVALIPLLFSGFFMVRIFDSSLSRQTASEAGEQLTDVKTRLNQMFTSCENACRTLTADSSTAWTLIDNTTVDYQKDLYLALYHAVQETYSYPRFSIYDAGGLLRFTTDGSGAIDNVLPIHWGLLRKASDSSEPVYYRTDPYLTSNSDTVLQAAYSLESRSGMQVGYVVLDFTKDSFNRLFTSFYTGRDTLILLDRFGEIIYCSRPEYSEDRIRQILEEARTGDSASRNRYYSVPDTDYGCTILLQKNAQISSRAIKTMQTISAALALFCLWLCLMISLALSRSISQPVSQLDTAMKKVRNGDLSIRIYTNRKDELGRLSESFNRMTGELKDNLDAAVQKQKDLNETTLKLYQTQLNPHFLYNTLDTIKWNARISHNPDIPVLAENLARILRRSISSKPFITLRQELETIRCYVEIQKIRFSGRFLYEEEIPDLLENCLIPKMILQPLVENAIYHGMEFMDGDGEIRIRAWRRDKDLFMSVSDNGLGMTGEQVKRLFGDTDHVPSGRGSGIGVKNVHQRIRLYFGNGYGLDIQSEPDEGTTVTAHLPAIPYEEVKKEGSYVK